MDRKGLVASAVGSMLAGAALFTMISPGPSDKTKFDSVTVEAQPTALIISSEVAFVQCLLVLNGKFYAPARLVPGETLVPWSRFIAEREVRFDPVTDGVDVLTIDCLQPVHSVGSFRFKH